MAEPPKSPTSGPEPLRIGRYLIHERIAEGGMAEVFLAQREHDERLCVLKRLHVRWEENETARKRLSREAHLATRLDHPNIARIIGAGEEEGRFCIALELVEGQTLESIAAAAAQRGRPFEAELALAIALQLLDALAYAHALAGEDGAPLGIVHRDVTPRNVMIAYDGTVKLIDFGVARGRVDDFETAPGTLLGTLRYLSPEQVRTTDVDARSDLYALGVLLHELLSGRPLVVAKNAMGVLARVAFEVPPPLSSLRPDLPPAIDAVMEKALAKDREARFADAPAFRDALLGLGVQAVDREALGAFVCALFPNGREQGLGRSIGWAPPLAETRAEGAGLTVPSVLPPITPAAPIPRMIVREPPRDRISLRLAAFTFALAFGLGAILFGVFAQRHGVPFGASQRSVSDPIPLRARSSETKLEAMLDALRANPKDAKLFDQLVDALKRSAVALSAHDRAQVERWISAAGSDRSLEPLEKATALILERSR